MSLGLQQMRIWEPSLFDKLETIKVQNNVKLQN